MKKLGIALLALSLAVAGCAGRKRTAAGTGIGAAVGAGLGAVIGHQSGNRDKGAAIGGAAGAIIGGAVGYKLDKQAEELAKIAETRRTEEGIVTTLKNSILFDTNSSSLKSGAVDNIGQIAEVLKKYPEDRLHITGHTDNTGKLDYNNQLSLQRANSVKEQLVKSGVSAVSINTSGAGPSAPVADNNTADGRSKNRRVELMITIPEQK